MKRLFLSLILPILFWSCNLSLTDPQKIVDKAIAAAGGEKYLHSTIEFDFRGRHYIGNREGGKFSYERIFINDKDSTQQIHDYIRNEGFKREINDVVTDVIDSMKVKYTASTNSVLYFALLPYGLNDPSVKKKFLGTSVLDSTSYYKIEIKFEQRDGGEDFEDTFHYWINTSDFTIGFLSYSYEEDNKVDCRLRKVINSKRVNGILFSNYINYSPKGDGKFEALDELYRKNEVKELSKIENSNIQVTLH